MDSQQKCGTYSLGNKGLHRETQIFIGVFYFHQEKSCVPMPVLITNHVGKNKHAMTTVNNLFLHFILQKSLYLNRSHEILNCLEIAHPPTNLQRGHKWLIHNLWKTKPRKLTQCSVKRNKNSSSYENNDITPTTILTKPSFSLLFYSFNFNGKKNFASHVGNKPYMILIIFANK